ADGCEQVCLLRMSQLDTVLPGMLEVKQHDDTEFRRHACQGDKTDTGGNRQVVIEQVQEPDTAGDRHRQGRHDQQRLVNFPEREVKEYEDDQQCCRDHCHESCIGALEKLELACERHADAGRQHDVVTYHGFQVGDHGGEVASAYVDIHPARQATVFTFQHRWSVGNMYIGHRAERDLL